MTISSRTRRRTRILATAALTAVCGLSGLVQAEILRERFDPDGTFWIYGKPPKEFEDFSGINLNAKRSRRLNPPGVDLSTGARLGFKSLSVSREKFTFETILLHGISYSFSGRFLKGGVFSAANLDDQTPVLEGVLSKFKNGQKTAEANLKFTYFGGT